jgi:hypothetical protein
VPAKLSARTGGRAIGLADVPALVAVAVKDLCHQTNPRPCSSADFESLFRAAL